MTRHILVINGHPDSSAERLCSALADAYTEGAQAQGHIVQRIDIGALEFPLLRRASEFVSAPDNDAITSARAQFLLAQHLVCVYPLWLGGPPALLKAFMEQIARQEFLLGAGAHGMPKGSLKGRSARVLVTMGMPAALYRLYYRAHGVKAFNRSILGIGGVEPIATTYLGGIGAPRTNTARPLEAMRQLGKRGV